MHIEQWSGAAATGRSHRRARSGRGAGIASVALASALGLVGGGCDLVAGIGEWCTKGVDPGCGTGGAGGTGASAGGGAGGTAGDGGSGGVGGSTSVGGTGGGVCSPEEKKSCYGGPAGTAGVGICEAGTLTCNPDGTGFGACIGEVQPGTETCAAKDDEDCNGTDCALWNKVFGDAGDETPCGVAVDSGGNVIVLGTFEEGISFGANVLPSTGATDVFLAKLTPAGEVSWAKSLGAGECGGLAVHADDRIVVSGSFSTPIDLGGTLTPKGTMDAYLATFDTMGGVTNVKQFGTSGNTSAGALAVSAAGDVFLGGTFDGQVNFGLGAVTAVNAPDAYLMKILANGDTSWVDVFKSPAYGIELLRLDTAGNVTLAGVYSGVINFGGDDFTAFSPSPDLFVARFDGGTGAHVWSKSFDTSGTGLTVRQRALTVDAVGNVYLGGEINAPIDWGSGFTPIEGSLDVFLAKLDSSGAVQWDRKYATAQSETFKGMVTDAAGDTRLLVMCPGGIDFGNGPISATGTQVFLANIGSGGTSKWSRRLSEQTSSTGIMSCWAALTPNGGLVDTCRIQGGLDLGLGNLTSFNDGMGNYDLVLFGLAP